MNFIPAYLYAWHRHIRYMLERTATPSSSETKKPLTFNYELYGRYLQARQTLLNQHQLLQHQNLILILEYIGGDKQLYILLQILGLMKTLSKQHLLVQKL